MPGTLMAMGHEAHGPNEYSSLCRACRIAGDIQAIEAAVNAPPSPAYTVTSVRHCENPLPGRIRCGQRTYRRCRTCRRPVCVPCLPSHVEHHASREVAGGRR